MGRVLVWFPELRVGHETEKGLVVRLRKRPKCNAGKLGLYQTTERKVLFLSVIIWPEKGYD